MRPMARAFEGSSGHRRGKPSAAEDERALSPAEAPDAYATVLRLQRSAGNAAVARLISGRAPPRGRLMRSASLRAPTPTSLTTPEEAAPSDEEIDRMSPRPVAVSDATDAGTLAPDAGAAEPDAGTPAPDAGAAEPDAGALAPDAGTPNAPVPPPSCTLTTRTLAAAADGTTPSTRTKVGVNERVEMTAPTAGNWTATGGRLSATTGTTVRWTAPVVGSAGGDFTITSTPAAGTACSVTMHVVRPERRQLTKRSNTVVPPGDRAYTAGLSGSGFVANVRVLPLDVSFSRLQVREGTVAATASGYYNTVLGWNGTVHPLGTWITLDARNGGIIDTVGTNPPGGPAPFSAGRFTWRIPQFYRRVGSTGNGVRYSVGTHRQVMVGATGRERTSKEGATRSRSP
jgi:hypothetical protein